MPNFKHFNIILIHTHIHVHKHVHICTRIRPVDVVVSNFVTSTSTFPIYLYAHGCRPAHKHQWHTPWHISLNGSDRVRSGQLARPDGSPVLGARNFIHKTTLSLPARYEGHELCFETMPGFSRCFLPITELFPADESTYLLLPSKRKSATSPVVGWRPVQTASQPSLRRQRFDVCSNFPILN